MTISPLATGSAPLAPLPARRFGLALLVLFSALLLMAAVRPLALPDEGRYGEMGRWMLVSGDWLVPRLDGVPYFRKPPLAYWLEAASMAVFGVNEGAVRLPAALHAALMVGALHWAARRLVGEAVAQRAALMLAASGAVLLGGQFANHDMMVAAWVSVALWCFVLALLHAERPHAGLARAGFAACALGVLAKGLLGIALPGLVLFVWIAVTRRWRQLPHLPWVSGLAIFLLIAAPWFVLAELRYPGMLYYMFGVGHFQRYTGQEFNNPQPWWFHFGMVFAVLLPWSLVLLARLAWPRARRAAMPAAWRGAWGLGAIWALAILVFFSIPRSKLPGYSLPVTPAVALLAAMAWAGLMAGRRDARWLALLAALPVLVMGGASLGYEKVARGKLAREAADALACLASPADDVHVVGGYPYDLAFRAQLQRPLILIQDWPRVLETTGDSWRRQRLNGAEFDPAAGARVLKTPADLAEARQRPGQWLVLHTGGLPGGAPAEHEGWLRVAAGRTWSLYRSPATAAAPAAPGLPGCRR